MLKLKKIYPLPLHTHTFNPVISCGQLIFSSSTKIIGTSHFQPTNHFLSVDCTILCAYCVSSFLLFCFVMRQCSTFTDLSPNIWIWNSTTQAATFIVHINFCLFLANIVLGSIQCRCPDNFAYYEPILGHHDYMQNEMRMSTGQLTGRKDLYYPMELGWIVLASFETTNSHSIHRIQRLCFHMSSKLKLNKLERVIDSKINNTLGAITYL